MYGLGQLLEGSNQYTGWFDHDNYCLGEMAENSGNGNGKKIAFNVIDGKQIEMEGNFLEYELDGTGKLIMPDTTYEGIFRHGAFCEGDMAENGGCGKGKLYVFNAFEAMCSYDEKFRTIFEGTFKNYYLHGEGKMSRDNNKVIQGHFHQGNLCEGEITKRIGYGNGKITKLSTWGQQKAIFEGSFVNYILHGNGIVTTNSGEMFSGQFHFDDFCEGKITSTNGSGAGKITLLHYDGLIAAIYEGNFIDYKLFGFGKVINKDSGQVFQGWFNDGNLCEGEIADFLEMDMGQFTI